MRVSDRVELVRYEPASTTALRSAVAQLPLSDARHNLSRKVVEPAAMKPRAPPALVYL